MNHRLFVAFLLTVCIVSAIPLAATGSMSLSERVTGYAGFGVRITRVGGYGDHTRSGGNPVAFLGATIPLGSAAGTAAAQLASAHTTRIGIALGLPPPLDFF